ncbi:MAG: organomercurial lyase [Actinomycetota bacterium]|nr:organomercurial lyase [Actinomycetota bacterium]
MAALPSLAPEERVVGLALYGLLAAGAPCTAEELASRSGLTAGRVGELLASLPTATVEAGAVTGFLGLRVGEGRHRVRFLLRQGGEEGTELAAWCAWDALFIPSLVGLRAEVRSRCPSTGAPISLEVDPHDGVVRASPEGVVLTFLTDPAPFCGDLVAGFCRWIHFFTGAEAAARWSGGARARERGGAPGIAVLSLADGIAVGRLTNEAIFGAAAPTGAAPRG